MKVQIEESVFERFSKRIRIGVIHLHDVDNRKMLVESQKLLTNIASYVHDTKMVEQGLIDTWKKKYETSRQYHSVVERYVKLIKNGTELRGRTVIDNLCMYLTLKHFVPIIADNLSNLEGDITFTCTKTDAEFEGYPVMENMLYVKDKNSAYSVSGDYWRSERSLCNTKSTDVLIRLEMLPPMTAAKFREIVTETIMLARKFTNGHGASKILTTKHREATFKKIDE